MKKTVLSVICGFSLALAARSQAQLGNEKISAAPNSEVFMSADVEGRQRSVQFDCHDGIYIHGVLSGFFPRSKAEIGNENKRILRSAQNDNKNFSHEDGKHEAYAVWFRPDGREQDRANYAFEGTDARFWFWLRLSPSFGGKFLKPIDPSYGMDEFIGLWRVDLYLDGKVVATKVFYVAC